MEGAIRPITETDQFKYREEENYYRMELSRAEASELVFCGCLQNLRWMDIYCNDPSGLKFVPSGLKFVDCSELSLYNIND